MTFVNKTMFPLSNSVRNINNMKAVFDKLQLQLATGEKASNLAEMGSDRFFDLGLRQRVARIEAYESNITTVGIRLSTLDTTLSRIDEIESDARAAAVSGIGGSEKVNLATFPTLAASRLDEVLSLLNTDVNGRYLFGGSTTETPPVASADAVLNGANGKADGGVAVSVPIPVFNRNQGGVARAQAELVAAGQLKPTISIEAPWTQIADVAQQLLNRSFPGKAVLHVA